MRVAHNSIGTNKHVILGLDWNLEVLVYAERGKPENLEKKPGNKCSKRTHKKLNPYMKAGPGIEPGHSGGGSHCCRTIPVPLFKLLHNFIYYFIHFFINPLTPETPFTACQGFGHLSHLWHHQLWLRKPSFMLKLWSRTRPFQWYLNQLDWVDGAWNMHQNVLKF